MLGALFGASTIAACGSFGTATSAPEAGADGTTSDTGGIKDPSTDGGIDDAPFVIGADGGKEDVDAGSGDCFSFLNSNDNGFVKGGEARFTQTGLRLPLKTATTATARRTFTSTKDIARSIIMTSGSLSIGSNKSWGEDNADFVGVLAQYYGTGTSTQESATTAFNLARGQSNPDFELTTWHAPANYDGFDRIGPGVANGIVGTITTEWKANADVRVESQGLDATVKASTLSGAKGKVFTLVLGGRSNSGNVPDVDIEITQVCVRFQ